MPSAPTHLCRFLVRCLREMLSGVPVNPRPSPAWRSARIPLPARVGLPLGSPSVEVASRTVIFAWVPWLNPPHLGPPFSFPLGTVGGFPRLSYPIRFSLGIGTFGFSAGWILSSILFVTHVNILTSDRTSVSRDSASHGTGSLTDFLSRFTERSTTFRPGSWGTPSRNHRFGFILSLLYLWRKLPHLVRCYAFFHGWLLPSPPPSCLRDLTSFRTQYEMGDLIG